MCLWPLVAAIIRTSLAWEVQRRLPSFRRGIASSTFSLLRPAFRQRDLRQRVERASSSTSLLMAVRNRGLEVRRETATPTGENDGSFALASSSVAGH